MLQCNISQGFWMQSQQFENCTACRGEGRRREVGGGRIGCGGWGGGKKEVEKKMEKRRWGRRMQGWENKQTRETIVKKVNWTNLMDSIYVRYSL